MFLIFLLISLLSSSFANGIMQDQISAGKVSAENEQLVKEIMEKFGVNRQINLAHPLDSLIKTNPKFSYIYFCPILNTLFINEQWLNELPKSERKFALATQISRLSSYQPETRFFLVGAIPLVGAITAWILINKYAEKINKFAKNIIKLGGVLGFFGISAKLTNKLVLPRLSKFFAKSADIEANRLLNLRKSGISFLKRMLNETTDDQRRQRLIERIENLKQYEPVI